MKVAGTATVWLENDIDTDQIIPARFLKVTVRAGLGAHLFADRPDFPRDGGTILIAGDNFGCGSSREHAPWALLDAGIRAVIARSFGDIFRANSLKNGLVPVALGAEDHALMVALARSGRPLAVDVETLTVNPGAATFTLDPFARKCLLAGVDELGYLLSFEPQISDYEGARP